MTGLGKGLEDEKHRHGLFTYHFLRALRGEADANRDSEVTLGEVAQFLSQKITAAARSSFKQEQKPFIHPLLRPGEKAAELILTRPASIQGASIP